MFNEWKSIANELGLLNILSGYLVTYKMAETVRVIMRLGVTTYYGQT